MAACACALRRAYHEDVEDLAAIRGSLTYQPSEGLYLAPIDIDLSGMTTPTDHTFAQRLAQLPDSRLLRADQATGAPLMCMAEAEKQTDHYLAIEHGDSADRGGQGRWGGVSA